MHRKSQFRGTVIFFTDCKTLLPVTSRDNVKGTLPSDLFLSSTESSNEPHNVRETTAACACTAMEKNPRLFWQYVAGVRVPAPKRRKINCLFAKGSFHPHAVENGITSVRQSLPSQ